MEQLKLFTDVKNLLNVRLKYNAQLLMKDGKADLGLEGIVMQDRLVLGN